MLESMERRSDVSAVLDQRRSWYRRRHAGGKSTNIETRANRWDAQEYESLKAERAKLQAEVEVGLGGTCTVLFHCFSIIFGPCRDHTQSADSK